MLRLATILLLLQTVAGAAPATTPLPEATPGNGERKPALAGAAGFQAALIACPFIALDDQQRSVLAQAGRLFDSADHAEKTDDPSHSPAEGPMLRGMASHMVLSVVGDMASVVALDLTKSTTVDRGETIPQTPLRGAMVLKTITGDGPADFRVADLNLGWSGDSNLHIHLPTAAAGTTYTLVRLEDIPFGRQIFTVQFVADGATVPGYTATIALETKEPGQLALTVVDETGEETPALVRLVSRETGILWEPPNAIDLKPIMTDITKLNIYGPGRAYTYYMPGDFRGPYWIVPSSFEAVIPPGEWELTVHHGYEHVPVRRTITVTSGQWTRERVTMERWIDMPARGWYSGDDHVHSRLVSSEDARALMAWVKATNINVANILEMGDPVRTWYEQRGFGRDFRVVDGVHVLVPGQEDPRSQFGHIIGLNLSSPVRDVDKYLLNDWVADEIHHQGGLYGHTHVGEGLFLGVARDMAMIEPLGKSDFASIMQNVLGTELYYEFLDLGIRVTASAGSDTPYGGAIGVTRSFVYIGEGAPFTADAWFDGMKGGHTFVTNGPMLDLIVDGTKRPGDEIPLTEDRRLVVRAAAFGRAEGSSPARVQLLYNGTVVHEELSPDRTKGEVAFSFELPAGYGGWLALRAEGHDGSQAHTTPVYIVRDGFRPWNLARVPELLGKRRATLDEIESMVAAELEKRDGGRLPPTDYYGRRMAQQAAGIRERVRVARDRYAELEAIAARETTLRAAANP